VNAPRITTGVRTAAVHYGRPNGGAHPNGIGLQREGAFSYPHLIFAGDMPTHERQMERLTAPSELASFVYHVFADEGELLYVGMTQHPVRRWESHRRQADWWDLATFLNLYRIDARDSSAAKLGARHWEAVAIHDALPMFNRQGPANLPAKRWARGEIA
jgi:hypothetical protein